MAPEKVNIRLKAGATQGYVLTLPQEDVQDAIAQAFKDIRDALPQVPGEEMAGVDMGCLIMDKRPYHRRVDPNVNLVVFPTLHLALILGEVEYNALIQEETV